LAFGGRRIGKLRPRRLRPEREAPSFWARWVAVIQRRPVSAAIGATAFMLLLASPALGLRLGSSDAGNDQASTTTRKAYDLLAQGFGSGFNGPLLLAAELPAKGDTTGLAQLTAAVRRTPDVASFAAPVLNPARDTAVISVYPSSSPQSSRTS